MVGELGIGYETGESSQSRWVSRASCDTRKKERITTHWQNIDRLGCSREHHPISRLWPDPSRSRDPDRTGVLRSHGASKTWCRLNGEGKGGIERLGDGFILICALLLSECAWFQADKAARPTDPSVRGMRGAWQSEPMMAREPMVRCLDCCEALLRSS